MAVVFISPKQRQKMFFLVITVMFLLFLIAISLGVFLAQPPEVSSDLVFNKPKVAINMGVFDSDQFKSLQPFYEMETLYSYKATDSKRKQQTGFISAISEEAARIALKDKGLSSIEVKEAEIGRDNPFIPYYTVVAPAATKK